MKEKNIVIITNRSGKIVAAAFEDEKTNEKDMHVQITPLAGQVVNKVKVPMNFMRKPSANEFHSAISHLLKQAPITRLKKIKSKRPTKK